MSQVSVEKKCFKCGNANAWELQRYVGIAATGWVCQDCLNGDGDDACLNCGS